MHSTGLLVFLGLAALANAQLPVHYKDCGSQGKLNKIVVTPCTAEPCQFKKGTTAELAYELVSDQDTNTVRIETTITVMGIQIPVPNVERDGCKITEGGCPLKKGQTYSGVLKVPVSRIAPVSKTVITIRVKGDNGVIVCGKTQIVLV